MVSFNSRVNKISPYIPGKPEEELKRELGLDHIVKLASNESPMGVSPLVKEAILHEIERVPLYPDDTYLPLKKKLALRHGVTPQEIVLGNGSVELIKNIVSSSCAIIGSPRRLMTAAAVIRASCEVEMRLSLAMVRYVVQMLRDLQFSCRGDSSGPVGGTFRRK